MTLATKTDAKGQVFSYSYDGMNRLTQISVGGTVLRTYVYDTNPDNPSYSGAATGRLTEIKYPAITYTDQSNGLADTTQFTDMFSYTAPGQVAGKLLQVTKSHTYSSLHPAQTAVGSLSVAYAYNSEGKLTSVTYPTALDSASNSNTPSFSYTYDQMMRLATMTESNTDSTMNHYTQPVVNGITYNAASQMTAMNYYQASETRGYNSLMQLTNIATTPPVGGTGINITYNSTSGANNGKIASTSDSISGETVTYQYDSLNRLISASGSGWTQTQAYDGFGNLTGRTGTGSASGTTISTPVNSATNQLSGYSYDNNGNLISTGYGYDAENRIEYANAGGVQYFYDGQNKRIWQTTCTSTCSPGSSWTLNAEVINMFGADGKQLASYAPSVPWNNTTTQLTVSFGIAAERAYFGGKLVAQLGSGGFLVSTIQDRLGSTGKYYPYGEERNSPLLANDQVKFATYTRDSATGNDYAEHRYYSSALGRFMTPDPYRKSGRRQNPISWNRYTYVLANPVNHTDRHGLDCDPDEDDGDCQQVPDPGGDYTCPPGESLDPDGSGDCITDPDPNQPDSGPPPSGGGSPSPSEAAAFTDSQDARADLSKPSCYQLFGFTSAAKAQTFFDKITFNYGSYGKLSVSPTGVPITEPAPANTLGYGTININTDYNWTDFSQVPTQQGGTFNYLGYNNRAYHTSMNSEQLGTLIILHELGHQMTAPKQPSDAESAAEKIAIYNDCIK